MSNVARFAFCADTRPSVHLQDHRSSGLFYSVHQMKILMNQDTDHRTLDIHGKQQRLTQNEPRREKTGFLHMRKTKTQISFAITAI